MDEWKWSRNPVGMFNRVQKHSKSTYDTTRHIQFTYRLSFVKCRFIGDTSETSFDPYAKWPFWQQERAITRAPHQIRILGFQYIFWPQNPPKWPVCGLKRHKRFKRHQKDPKMSSKRCQNDPPPKKKWCQNDPKVTPKMTPKRCQNDPKVTPKRPRIDPEK